MTKQRTIKNTVSIKGAGLQTGKNVTLTLKASPPDSGINFIRTDLPNLPLLSVRSAGLAGYLKGPDRRTTLTMGPVEIQTTEHLMAALSGMSIDNAVVELDNVELPGLDGSALGYVEILRKAGILEQDAARKALEVREPVWCRGEDNILAVFPDDNFRISYTMSYGNKALGAGFFDIVLDEKKFASEIAPARTFCLKGEALLLMASGLGKGANPENTLVVGKNGPFRNRFRFPDEPVRHKVLDLIGDLYLLGVPIKGHVVAIKSGHRLNVEMVKKLRNQKPVT